MKVILSRKGIDSGNCDIGNLLICDTEGQHQFVVLPIPSNNTNMRYQDLDFSGEGECKFNKKGLEALSRSKIITPQSLCHADPNIVNYFCEKNFLGSIGQVDQSQTHLSNYNIKNNDIFIFFGLFDNYLQNTNTLANYNKHLYQHIMFGYLQIGEIIFPNKLSSAERVYYEEKYPWIKNQPHWNIINYKDRQNNCIYIARETCSFDNTIKGYGMFKFDNGLVLTKQGQPKRSRWSLPKELEGLKISYHTQNSYKTDYFQSACRGQEFVIEESPAAEKWVMNLIKHYAKK